MLQKHITSTYLECHQKLSQIVVEFSSLLKVSIELHEGIISLKRSIFHRRIFRVTILTDARALSASSLAPPVPPLSWMKGW